jgi:hypothetical protein
MATQGGSDGIINVPTGGGTVTYTETASGGVTTASGATSGVSGGVSAGGTLTATGGSYNNSTWTMGSGSTLNFSNTSLNNSSVTGDGGSNNINVGTSSGAKVKATVKTIYVAANMAAGDDSVSFAKRSLDKSSSYDLGTGADSITFARGAQAKRTDIDLGVDNDGDRVKIAKLDEFKRVVIDNFDKGDTLKIGGKTYEYADLQKNDGKFGNNLKVNLD